MAPSLPRPVRLNWRALLLQRRERRERHDIERAAHEVSGFGVRRLVRNPLTSCAALLSHIPSALVG